MIKKFKNQETKESGIIYKANLDSVKELYLNGEKELAFETAVACMELACGGKISSENFLVKAITANLKEVADRTNQKYEEKKQRTAQERITKLQLNEIAEMLNNGVNQQTIADTLNQSKQTISYSELLNVKRTKELESNSQEEIIVRSLKQPSCTKVEINGEKIEYSIEKELGIEIVGDTKMRISVDEEEDEWEEIIDEEEQEEISKQIENSVEENFINEDK